MAVELKLSKCTSDEHWGFRLVGGADFNQPIVVVKVNENSVAEKTGLEVGDVIVRINETPTSGLTHKEVHDVLLSTELELNLAVRKGMVSANIISEVDYDMQFSKIVKELEESVEKHILDEAVKRFEEIEKKDSSTDDNVLLSENLSGQEKVLYIKEEKSQSVYSEALTHGIKRDKKWSTFLVKPDAPVPKLKKKREDDRTIEGQPYKVVIKKQMPKRFFAKEKRVQFDQNVIQVEVEEEEEFENLEQQEEKEEIIDNNNNVSDEFNEQINNENEEIFENNLGNDENAYDETNEGYENDESNNDDDNQLDGESEEDIKFKPLSEIIVETDENNTITLEEQLKQVQKQLQALSQLPSAVQFTLDAVSKQLADLVANEEEEQRENVEEEKSDSVSEMAEDLALAAVADAETDDMDADSVIGDELEQDIITEEIREIMERSEKDVDDVENEEDNLDQGMTKEEIERQLQEEEALAKKQKVAQLNKVWPWADENKPVYRINFLKYQPPPKNLDYLQHSEVYRLIHDMEPPSRGIVSRPEYIPSVQDYYEATKEVL